MNSSGQNVETLANLYPNDFNEPHFQKFKNSLRTQGSLRMILKKPSRHPQYVREFQNGDPIHLIDWKAYARTDQLILRERQDEACSYVLITVDCSPSMYWPENKIARMQADWLPKIEISFRIAFNLANAHISAGDRVLLRLANAHSKELYELNLRSQMLNVQLFNEFHSQRFTMKTLLNYFMESRWQKEAARDIHYLVSDGLSPSFEEFFVHQNAISFYFQNLSSYEMNLNWLDSDSVYFDSSSMSKDYLGRTLLFEGSYDRQLQKYCHKIKNQIEKQNGFYFLLSEKTSILSYYYFLTHSINQLRRQN